MERASSLRSWLCRTATAARALRTLCTCSPERDQALRDSCVGYVHDWADEKHLLEPLEADDIAARKGRPYAWRGKGRRALPGAGLAGDLAELDSTRACRTP